MAKMIDLVQYLENNGIPFEIIKHQPAFTAHEVATVSRVPDKELAKTLIVSVDGKFWMAVLRGDQRISERSLKRSFGASQVHLAHEEDLNSLFPGCEMGAMPPFGNLYGLPVIIEKSLAEDEEIVFNACRHTECIKMRFRDYERLVQPLVGHFAEPHHVYEDWELP